MEQKPKWQRLLESKNAIALPQIDERKLQEAIGKFLLGEPEWLDRAVANDPALQKRPDGTPISKEEAYTQLFTYQGLHAIALHREANALYKQGRGEEARALSQAARHITGGIEIHPGATIGNGFFVDHGAGVVIGETAQIGDNVFLYHTVTLGATGNPNDVDNSDPAHPNRRHPKLGDNVKIANGAQLIGPITVEDNVQIGTGARIIGKVHIGKGARISPGVEVYQDVAPGEVVVGAIPYIPGVTDRGAGARMPITRPGPGTNIRDAQWLGYLARAHGRLADMAADPALH